MFTSKLARIFPTAQAIGSAVLVVVCVFALKTTVPAQQPTNIASAERARGIQLFNANKNEEAIDELRVAVKKDKNDGDAWYYLGLALVRIDDMKGARKAFESAVKLKPDFGPAHTGFAYALIAANKDSEVLREARAAIKLRDSDHMAHYLIGVVRLRAGNPGDALSEAETAIAQNKNFGPAYLLKSQALLALQSQEAAVSSQVVNVRSSQPLTDAEQQRRRERARKTRETYAAAATALQTYLKLVASDRETAMWKEQLETLQIFAGTEIDPTAKTFYGRDVTTRVKVLSKPEPGYTDQARSAGISGTVILRAVFSATGTVDHILVIRSLPGGLTEQAIQAAKKIKFMPATKDGKMVSMLMELQYNFSVF
jgi:TonB family protein